MKYNNEQIIFDIPPLSSEWSFNAKLYCAENDNIFYVSSELLPIKANEICRFSIFHTLIGDIHKFDVTCRVFTMDCEYSYDYILEPIMRKFCNENIIELNLYKISYE